MNSITRRALLIGAPGDKAKGNWLTGVNPDIGGFHQFLMSTNGGAWSPGEITRLINPSTQELAGALTNQVGVSYSFVLFSGHGGIANHNNRTYISINNEDMVPVDCLVNKAERELVLVDSCRSYYDQITLDGDRIVEVRKAWDPRRENARAIFDGELAKSEKGFLVLYAASAGEAANDTPQGGVFSQTLLALQYVFGQNSNTNDVLPVNAAFSVAQAAVSQSYKYQNPQMVGSTRRRYWFPFCINV